MTDNEPMEPPPGPLNGSPVATVGENMPPPPPDEPMPMNYPAVLIMRVPQDQPGTERLEIMPINGLDPLSVPTVLALALKIKNNELGIGG